MNRMLKMIKCSGLDLPERELCILATASADLLANYGVDVSKEEVVIQTVPSCNSTQMKSMMVAESRNPTLKNNILPRFQLDILIRNILSDPGKTQDQNFHRGMFLRSNPRLVNCLIPKGRYVLTKQWRVLSAKDLPMIIFFQSVLLLINEVETLLKNTNFQYLPFWVKKTFFSENQSRILPGVRSAARIWAARSMSLQL